MGIARSQQYQNICAAPVTQAVSNNIEDSTPQVNNKTTDVQICDPQKMLCSVCNWVYDPALGEPNQGIEPGTPWNELPDFFLCPECGLGKDVFVPITESKAS